MFQVFMSLEYLHSLGICHRDIKPQNLLLDPKKEKVKLCDFGSAKYLLEEKPNETYIGSRFYRAPELLIEEKFYTSAVDIWSVGCVIGELLLGKPMFSSESSMNQLETIISVIGTPSDIVELSPKFNKIALSKVNLKSWTDVFQDKNIEEELKMLLSNLFEFNPKKRISAEDAIKHSFFLEVQYPTKVFSHNASLSSKADVD